MTSSRTIPKQTSTASSTLNGVAAPHCESTYKHQSLVQELESASANSASFNELLYAIAKIIAQQAECLSLWVSQRETPSAAPASPGANEAASFASFHSLTDDDADSIWPTIEDTARPLVANVVQTQQIAATPLPFGTGAHMLAAPIRVRLGLDRPIDYVLLGCFQTGEQTVLRLQWLLGLATLSIAQWFHSQMLAQSETKQRTLMDAIKLIHELNLATSNTHAAMVIVNQLRQLLKVDSVAIAIQGKLMAVSDVEQLDPHNESNQLTRIACNQTLETGEPVAFLDSKSVSTPQQLALEAYCRSQRVEACLNVPLAVAGESSQTEAIAGLLIAGKARRLADPGVAEYIGQLTGMLGPHLEMVLRANRGVKQFTAEKIQSLRKHRWRTRVLFLIAAVGIAMCFPLPYRVACDCELQPVLRRFVAAPYDGILESTLVENGEIVAKNQLLAIMDGRNLRIELAGLQAELAGAKKRKDSALAMGDIAQSQIARSETDRLEAKIELLQQRTANLEVRSPIDGIIVSGDLEKAEGAPLEMGQTLFEVAPLDRMLSEIAIPESEIKHVRPDMQVAIKLNAFPFQTWAGTIAAVHPSAEMIDNKSVFIAQVELVNDKLALRPGMKGSAKVKSSVAPLGWSLFHRPWEAVRYWLIW